MRLINFYLKCSNKIVVIKIIINYQKNGDTIIYLSLHPTRANKREFEGRRRNEFEQIFIVIFNACPGFLVYLVHIKKIHFRKDTGTKSLLYRRIKEEE